MPYHPTHILPSTESITQGPRLVVPLKHPFLTSLVQPDPNYLADEYFGQASLNIRDIQHHSPRNLSFEECYRLSYQLVVSKHGQMLYDGVRDLVVENLNRLAQEIILPAFPSGLEQDPMRQNHEGERLLEAVHEVWSDHTDGMDIKLCHILRYMVRPITRVATDLRMYVLRTAYL